MKYQFFYSQNHLTPNVDDVLDENYFGSSQSLNLEIPSSLSINQNSLSRKENDKSSHLITSPNLNPYCSSMKWFKTRIDDNDLKHLRNHDQVLKKDNCSSIYSNTGMNDFSTYRNGIISHQSGLKKETKNDLSSSFFQCNELKYQSKHPETSFNYNTNYDNATEVRKSYLQTNLSEHQTMYYSNEKDNIMPPSQLHNKNNSIINNDKNIFGPEINFSNNQDEENHSYSQGQHFSHDLLFHSDNLHSFNQNLKTEDKGKIDKVLGTPNEINKHQKNSNALGSIQAFLEKISDSENNEYEIDDQHQASLKQKTELSFNEFNTNKNRKEKEESDLNDHGTLQNHFDNEFSFGKLGNKMKKLEDSTEFKSTINGKIFSNSISTKENTIIQNDPINEKNQLFDFSSDNSYVNDTISNLNLDVNIPSSKKEFDLIEEEDYNIEEQDEPNEIFENDKKTLQNQNELSLSYSNSSDHETEFKIGKTSNLKKSIDHLSEDDQNLNQGSKLSSPKNYDNYEEEDGQKWNDINTSACSIQNSSKNILSIIDENIKIIKKNLESIDDISSSLGIYDDDDQLNSTPQKKRKKTLLNIIDD